jgi:hypothetical protein
VSKAKIGWLVGLGFITDYIGQLSFLVQSSMLSFEHWDSRICEVHL